MPKITNSSRCHFNQIIQCHFNQFTYTITPPPWIQQGAGNKCHPVSFTEDPASFPPGLYSNRPGTNVMPSSVMNRHQMLSLGMLHS